MDLILKGVVRRTTNYFRTVRIEPQTTQTIILRYFSSKVEIKKGLKNIRRESLV